MPAREATAETARITPELAVGDRVRLVPQAAAVLRTRGLVCIECGEPVRGRPAEPAAGRGIVDLAAIHAAAERSRQRAPRE